MRPIPILFALLFLNNVLYAQEVEFHIPDEIEIIQGQLSVVFNEDVKEAEAVYIIEGYEYEVLKTNFTPVIISGHLESPLDEELIARMIAHEHIQTAEQFVIPAPVLTTRNEAVHSATEHSIAITFASGVTQNEAKKLLKNFAQPASMTVQSLPNEVVISVGNQDEKAFDLLQENKHVRWVSYVGASGDS